MIDQAILWLLFLILVVEFFHWLIRVLPETDRSEGPFWGVIARLAALAFIAFFYFVLFEFFQGRTPGKIFAGTVVKTVDGDLPGFWRVVWRTVLRWFPWGIFHPLTVLIGRTSRGWHDWGSGTVVTLAVQSWSPMPEAQRWKRVLSGLVDVPLALLFALPAAFVAVVFLQGALAGVVMNVLHTLLVLLLIAVWYAFFETLGGRTPGKLLTGIAVRGEDGTMPDRTQIWRRSLVRMIPVTPLSIFFPGRKIPGEGTKRVEPSRWWHDAWTGTRVVQVEERKWLEARWLELSIWWWPAPWLRGSLFYDLLLYPGIWLPLGGLVLVTIFWFGRSFGAPLLFWHDQPVFAFVAGITTAMTVAWGILLFFSLNYSKWLERREEIKDWVKDWAKQQGMPGAELRLSTPASGRDYLPCEVHWTNRLFAVYRRHFDRPVDSDPDAKALDRLRIRSYFFRSVTHAVFSLLAMVFVVRLAVVEWYRVNVWLERMQGATGASAAGLEELQNRINEIGKGESVSFWDWRWWMFPLGWAIGIVVVQLLDRFKFKVWKAISSGRRKVWNEVVRERRLMYLMGGYGILVLILIHLSLALLGEGCGQFLAAPALCVMTGWIMLIYALVALLLRNLAKLAVGAVVVFLMFVLAGPGLVQNQRYEYVNLERGENLTPICISQDPVAGNLAGFSDEASADGNRLYRDVPTGGKPGEVELLPAQWESGEPLIIVCASGGGITAEVWAVELLNLLSRKLEGFAENVRIVTGASGGMVGASAWAQLQSKFAGIESAELPESEKRKLRAYLFGKAEDDGGIESTLSGYQSARAALYLAEKDLRERCDRDQLSPTALRMALCDTTLLGLVQRFPLMRHRDRGNVLERLWVGDEGMGREGILPGLGATLGSMARLEREGKAPSLIFAPMIAEDGRQFLVSNLELSRLTYVASSEGQNPYFKDRIVTAVEAGSILGFEKVRNQPISSWARMSATFPLVTPAGTIQVKPAGGGEREPKEQVLHLVDAGYSDNYGTPTAVGWLREYWLPWIKQGSNAPKRVILIELDAYPRYGDTAWSYPAPPNRIGRIQKVAQDFAQEQADRMRTENPSTRPAKDEEQQSQAQLLPPEKEERFSPLVTMSDILFEDASSVLTGVMNRNRSAVFRSEQIVEQFSQTLAELKGANPAQYEDLDFRIFRLINPVPASLSWALSTGERKLLETLSHEMGEFLDKPHPARPGDPSLQYLIRRRNDSATAAHAAYTFLQLFELSAYWARQRGEEGALEDVEPWIRWVFDQESRKRAASRLPAHDEACEREFNGLQMELVRCEGVPGESHGSEETMPFWISSQEVTQGQWFDLMGEIYQVERPRSPAHPLEGVTKEKAEEFCRVLTGNERKEKRIDSTWRYTLPTPEQWERACRAGGEGEFSPGDVPLEEVAWFQENSEGHPHKTGQKKPNTWGLYDMHGNVSEWCVTPESAVLRGGDALSLPDQCRAGAQADGEAPGALRGFRPVLQMQRE